MRMPLRAIHSNIVWSRTSPRAWAVWRIAQPVSFRYLPRAEKLRIHDQIRSTLHNLPDQSSIISVCRYIDQNAVLERMNIGATQTPAWARHMTQAADLLADNHAWDRYFFIVAGLPTENRWGPLSAALSEIGSSLGFSPAPVGRSEIERRTRQADHLHRELGGGIDLRSATPGEIRWLYQRSAYRGLFDPGIDTAWNPQTPPTDSTLDNGPDRELAPLVSAVYHEGGTSDDADRPRHRRYLRIDTEAGTSYQTSLVMASLPHRWEFPDGAGEWWAAADTAPFPIDWYVRITSVPNQVAQARSRRQHRQLRGQVDEYDGDSSGVPAALMDALDSIDSERRELSSAPSTPELEATLVFSVASHSLAGLEEQAAAIRSQYGAYEYDLPRPTGAQLALHTTGLPGSEAPQVCKDYAQYFMPRDLAAGLPFLSARVGDPIGMLLGYSLDGGSRLPVLFDPAYGPQINRSGSVGVMGHLGSGKSYFIKQVTLATLARGGRVVILDRTASAEYVKFSSVAPGTTQIVEFSADADVRIDPIRMFQLESDKAKYTQNFLTLLTGVSPTSPEGSVLGEACRHAAGKPDGSIADVITYLSQVTDRGDYARQLSYQLSSFAADGLAQMVFGDGPPLDLHADLIVMHTPGLQLPDREHLMNAHLASKLLPEQVFSQAVLYLITAIARNVTFSDTRFAAALFDEAWSLVSSPQGEALLLEGIRDGRKHNAAIWLLSQLPTDIPEKVASLLGNRFVFRQAVGEGPAALDRLGTDPTQHLIELIETQDDERNPPGRGLFRDVEGRIGLIQVTAPGDPTVAAAIDTTPDRYDLPVSGDYQLSP